MKILIITGGTSSERKISFLSAREVKKALEESNFIVKLYNLKNGYLGLKKALYGFDVIFPVIHGEEGEGGKLHKFLSKQGIPFVGGDPKGMQKGWYKIPFKKFCKKYNVKTAPWRVIKSMDDIIKFGFPCVLKASSGGSSKEVVILKTEKDLKRIACRKLLASKDKLFVERFIEGIEITVGILGNKALPVIEIIPPAGGWFDYKNKYSGISKELPNAPSLNLKMQREIQKTALNIHQNLGLGSLSRIDFIVADDKAYVLEINTIPGMTANSLLPKAALAAGISFVQMVKDLLETARI